MRTLGEILEGAKDGRKPTHDECYFAMLALDGLSTFTARALREIASEETKQCPAWLQLQADEDFRRWKTALGVPPDEYLGPGHTPGNPEFEQRRRVAKAILRKVEERRR